VIDRSGSNPENPKPMISIPMLIAISAPLVIAIIALLYVMADNKKLIKQTRPEA
jgi:hypothetical protein